MQLSDGMGLDDEGFIPFLTDDTEFARGVEFGLLVARMYASDDCRIKEYILTENEDQVCVAAGRLGWKIVKLRASKKILGWSLILMKRVP